MAQIVTTVNPGGSLPTGTAIAVHKLGAAGADGILGADLIGNNTAAVAVSASLTVVKASAALLSHVLVTTAGTAAMTFFDNASAASGTVVGVIPANTPAGSSINFSMPCLNGIVASGNASNPAVTVSFA